MTVSFLGIHKSDFWYSMDIYIGFSLALHLQCIASQDAMRLNTGLLAVRRSNNSTGISHKLRYSLYFQVLILTYFFKASCGGFGILGNLISIYIFSNKEKNRFVYQNSLYFCVGDLWYLDEHGLQLKTSNQEEIKRYFLKSVQSLSLSLFY
jgi:hypothetical protein